MTAEVQSIARIALGVSWGGALCALGAVALWVTTEAISSARAGAFDKEGCVAATILCAVFAVAALGTMSAANLFHPIDWLVDTH